jgi:hypothetical protein
MKKLLMTCGFKQQQDGLYKLQRTTPITKNIEY